MVKPVCCGPALLPDSTGTDDNFHQNRDSTDGGSTAAK